MAIIVSKKEGMIVIPVPILKNAEGKAHRTVSQKVLIKGSNYIEDDIWKELRKIKSVKWKLDNGLLEEVLKYCMVDEEVEEEVDGKKKKSKKKVRKTKFPRLNEIKTEEAILLVKDCRDPDVLRKWSKQESRDSVRSYIKDQLDFLKDYALRGEAAIDERNAEEKK